LCLELQASLLLPPHHEQAKASQHELRSVTARKIMYQFLSWTSKDLPSDAHLKKSAKHATIDHEP